MHNAWIIWTLQFSMSTFNIDLIPPNSPTVDEEAVLFSMEKHKLTIPNVCNMQFNAVHAIFNLNTKKGWQQLNRNIHIRIKRSPESNSMATIVKDDFPCRFVDLWYNKHHFHH